MKLIVIKGCYGETLLLNGELIQNSYGGSNRDLKRQILFKIISKITRESDLEQLIVEISNHLTPVKSEFETCGQCDNYNSEQEFEI